MFAKKRNFLLAATMSVSLLTGLNCWSSALAAEYRQSDVDNEVKHFSSSEQSERISAAYRISEMGPDAKSAVPGLIQLLDTDPSDQVRGQVAQALGRIGPAAIVAVPSLIAFLQNTKCGYERTYASSALGDIGLEPTQAVPALIYALQNDDEPVVRQLSARALRQFGVEAAPAIPALIDALKTGNKELRSAAAYGLSEIPARASDVLGLTDLLKDEIDESRAAAARSIGGAGGEASAAVPQLVLLLSDQNVSVRTAAAVGLGGVGPAAKSAIPALQLAQKNAETKYEATRALEQIRRK